jgi:hypothetical protein
MHPNDTPTPTIDTAALFREVKAIRDSYEAAVNRYWDIEDADAPESETDAAYRLTKELQQEHIDKMRALRQAWGDNSSRERERIDLVPGKCRAMVGWLRQCSRDATMLLGDLGVCTQHYNLIEDDSDPYKGYPDLLDIDGRAFAGHAVLEPFPSPWLWDRIERVART